MSKAVAIALGAAVALAVLLAWVTTIITDTGPDW